LSYRFIAGRRGDCPVAWACDALGVSGSGYHAWAARPPPAAGRRREELAAAIAEIHAAVKGRCGSPRMTAALKARGRDCPENAVAALRKARGIRAKAPRRSVRTTDSRHGLPVAENVLARGFDPAGPNAAWSADITYIPTADGWPYLAVVEGLFSRRIVGWAMDGSMASRLVADAPAMAIRRRPPGGGLVAHPGRGGQYAGDHHRGLLGRHGTTCSVSRVARCWDNAPVESLFASLKRELVHGERYTGRDAARASLFEYVEASYSRVRLHSSLGHVAPAGYERAHNPKRP
jgi:putative transposase